MDTAGRTQYKLEEAKFFLALLEQNWRHSPHFDYFLSAFVSSARSVAWVMKSEYGARPGWTEWYEQKKPSAEMRVFLKKMNDVRVRATKSTPLKTQTTATVTIPPEQQTPELLAYLEGGTPGLVRLEPTDHTNTEAFLVVGARRLGKVKIEKALHEIPEFGGRDVREVCREYMRELEVLWAECKERYEP
jgi:hypothetical protein